MSLILGCVVCSHASLRDCALILTEATDRAGMERAIREAEAAGCRVRHVFPYGAIIAVIPSDGRLHLSWPATVLRDAASVASGNKVAALAISAWNHALKAESAAPWPSPGAPLVNDVLPPPSAARTRIAAPGSSAPGPQATSYFMIGRVAVGIILPESKDGTENWTPDREGEVLGEVMLGLDWWAEKGGAPANLTFFYDTQLEIPCDYEPIKIGSSNHGLWVSDVLGELGYTQGDAKARALQYVNDLRAGYVADWGFAVFVADSLVDADGRFPDGAFAFCYEGGPYAVMTYDNNDWGIYQMHLVTSHETGHIFYAADEYCDAYYCCTFDYCGYLNVYNGNCEYENLNSVPCMMRHDEDAVCVYTRGQVGWRDTDGDGIFDPVDTTPVIGSASYEIGGGQITYTGYAQDVPFDSPNPYFQDVTINKIALVEYRVNGGEWRQASAADGAFDSDVEDFIFVVTPPPESPTVEIRTKNTVGNYSSITLLGPGDTTPPTMPVVDDVGAFTASRTEIEASWSSEDPETGISLYEYAVGTTPGGTDIRGWTSAGTSTHEVIGGLNLTTGQTYYVSVKARNGNGLWSEVGSSDGIMVVDAVGPAGARSSPDGKLIGLESVVVSTGTNQFSSVFYVESADRCAGIKVVPASPPEVAPGDVVNITGYTDTSVRERQIIEPITLSGVSSDGGPIPLQMCNRAVGGADANEYTKGVDGGTGLNNIGLLISTTGEVTHVDAPGCYFYVDDGSHLLDAFPKPGVRVYFGQIAGSFTPPSEEQYVRVTGISTIKLLNSKYVRMIWVREQGDLVVFP